MAVTQASDSIGTMLGNMGRNPHQGTTLAPLVAICAGAGILIGVLTSTGLNLKLTYLIDIAGGGNLALTLFLTMIACLILGMGLPTVAA